MIELPDKLQCLFEPKRYKFIKGGRGSTKSWSVARALLVRGTQQPLRWLCTREIQKSIKQSVHQLLRDQIRLMRLGAFYQAYATEIRGRNGTLLSFAGLSDQTVDSIKSFEGYDGVWVEEGQTTSRRSWQILIPTIRKDGSEIWVTYNPELDTDETHVMATRGDDDSVTVVMNYEDNPWFNDVMEKERAKAQRLLPEAEYNHIWRGMTLPAVKGAIYFDEVAAAEASGRIGRFPRDPALKVHRVWDMGWNDAMAICLVQRLGSQLTIIGFITGSHRTVAQYLADFRNDERFRGWNWGKDFLPHDGFAKSRQTGKADADILRGLGCDVVQTPSLEVEQGIRAARAMFPRVYIDREGCAVAKVDEVVDADTLPGLVECLKRYRRRINQQTKQPEAPLHDVHSNGADAFRYTAINAEQMTNEDEKPLDLPVDDETGGTWMSI